MRFTVIPGMHLSKLPLPTRILVSLYVVSVFAALAVGSLKYTQRAEFTPSGATRYWHGDAEAGDGLDALERGAPPPPEKKSDRYLVDVVHPHLFTVPVVLFLLLHLLSLTRLPDAAKIAFHVHAFASLAATFGLPFLVAASGSGGTGFVVAGVNLLLSFVGVGAILLFETWFPRARPPESAGDLTARKEP